MLCKNAPCSDLDHLLLLLLLLHLHRFSVTAAVSHEDVCPRVAHPLPRLKAFLLQRFADPGAVAVRTQGLEELLLGLLEGRSGHLGLGVGGQREEVVAAEALAQGAKQDKQVGLGDPGRAQFVPGGRKC